MHGTIFPTPLINFSIRPKIFSITMPLILQISPFIFLNFIPNKKSLSIHHIILPSTIISSSIWPCLHSFTTNVSIFELAYKYTAIIIIYSAITISLTINILTCKYGWIGSHFFAFPILNIFQPISFMGRSINVYSCSFSIF